MVIPTSRQEIRFALLLTAIYLIVILLGLTHHEMWRDELQAWMIARDAASIFDLKANLSFEGHPPLWHLGLWVITRFTHDPHWMQFYHALLAAGFVFVFLAFAPFPRWQRALFTLGYYPLFEYSLKSRCYALGILLLFITCALHRPDLSRMKWQFLCLLLLAWTHAYGMVLAVGYVVLLGALVFRDARSQWKTWLAGSIIVLIGTGLSYWFALPSDQLCLPNIIFTDNQFTRYLRVFADALFICLKPPSPYHYASFFINPPEYNIILGVQVVAVGTAVLLVVSLRRFWPGLLFLGVISAEMIYAFTRYLPGPRHEGTLFFAYLTALWISRISATGKQTDRRGRMSLTILGVFLVSHAIMGLTDYRYDWFKKFSRAQDVALYLQANHLDTLPLFGIDDTTTSPIGGYLDKKMYYPYGNKVGSFIQWTWARVGISEETVAQRLGAVTHYGGGKSIFILDFPMNPKFIPESVTVTRLRGFGGPVETWEEFTLYLIVEKPGNWKYSEGLIPIEDIRPYAQQNKP